MIVQLKLDNFQKFNHICTRLESDVNIASGRYVVDGKSIMGLFSLDLSKPLSVTVLEKNPGDAELFRKMVAEEGIEILES